MQEAVAGILTAKSGLKEIFIKGLQHMHYIFGNFSYK